MDINYAISRVSLQGGGTVRIPRGVHHTYEPLLLRRGVRLRGVATGVTTIMAHGDHAIAGEPHLRDATIQDLTINGWNLRAGHGIRLAPGSADVLIERVRIEGPPSYGIGLQRRDDQAGFKKITMRDIDIFASGADGIDIKDIDTWPNEEILMSAVRICAHGRLEEHGKAGIDIRGEAIAENVFVNGMSRGNAYASGFQVGVRVRWGPAILNNIMATGTHNARGIVIEAGPVELGVYHLDTPIQLQDLRK